MYQNENIKNPVSFKIFFDFLKPADFEIDSGGKIPIFSKIEKRTITNCHKKWTIIVKKNRQGSDIYT